MPNWAEQTLDLVGPETEIARWCATGFTVPRGRLPDTALVEPTLDFESLCPRRGGDGRGKEDPYAAVLMYWRTRTQARFEFITRWDYPRHFYRAMARHWPHLAFACAVNEDMGQFGGVLVGIGGRMTDLVRTYSRGYDKKAHAKEILPHLQQWQGVVQGGREWRVRIREPWETPFFRTDATFDDDGWFYLRTEQAARRFRARAGATSLQRHQADGRWHTVRTTR